MVLELRDHDRRLVRMETTVEIAKHHPRLTEKMKPVIESVSLTYIWIDTIEKQLNTSIYIMIS